MNILLVDDDYLSINAFYEDLIEVYQYNVDWIKKVDNVIEMLENGDYNAIVLDIMMPVPDSWSQDERKKAQLGILTGEVLLKKIRAKYPTKPILIYSSKPKFQTDEFTKHVRKPGATKQIIETLISLVAKP